MKKDIIFLVTDELLWQDRLAIAKNIMGQDITVIHGANNILESFRLCAAQSTTDLFVMIDGDNILHPSAKEVIECCTKPTVFSTNNKFGISYGHGGVKVISKFANFEHVSVIDVTQKLSLSGDDRVISFHDFHFSEYNEWKTIFKELIKLFLWGNKRLLRLWLAHPLPRLMFRRDLVRFMKNATLDSIELTINTQEILWDLYQSRNDNSTLSDRISIKC